ncbi:hypothetical protein SSX86_002081 [Deinandra increscens subsp. villosa]|uniref:Transposase n=1 Tax=Deinandra increscens subsp. villosa TaxID=3103831 RepID=A0AAP0DVL0_9ASTR
MRFLKVIRYPLEPSLNLPRHAFRSYFNMVALNHTISLHLRDDLHFSVQLDEANGDLRIVDVYEEDGISVDLHNIPGNFDLNDQRAVGVDENQNDAQVIESEDESYDELSEHEEESDDEMSEDEGNNFYEDEVVIKRHQAYRPVAPFADMADIESTMRINVRVEYSEIFVLHFRAEINPRYTSKQLRFNLRQASKPLRSSPDFGFAIKEHGEKADEPFEHNYTPDFTSGIPTDAAETIEMVEATEENFMDHEHEKFIKLIEDAEKPLYKGCSDFSMLSALVQLFNLKSKYGVSDKCFTKTLVLIKKMLPEGNEMVNSTYEAKKTFKEMGSWFTKIHACINHCILYRNDYKDLQVCPTCGKSRWKVYEIKKVIYENVPEKVLWYFPIIPRLKRLFPSKTTACDLRWHAESRIKDDVLRHPADSTAWTTIDDRYLKIANDPRSLRLGISADGVDVNRGNQNHSVWPILSVIYNLPPWLCMKRKFIMLALLISRTLGNDIDVF